MIGDGATKAALAEQIARRGLANVTLLGLRPRAEIPRWIASIDLQVVLLRDLAIFQSVIPSKIFEFCAQERPVILSAPKGEIRGLVEAARVAVSIEPEQPGELAGAILALRGDPEGSTQMARRGRAWVESGFVRDDLARRMLSFVERVAGGSP